MVFYPFFTQILRSIAINTFLLEPILGLSLFNPRWNNNHTFLCYNWGEAEKKLEVIFKIWLFFKSKENGTCMVTRKNIFWMQI